MLQVALNFMGLRSKRGVSSKKSSSAVTVTLKAPEGLALENEHEEPEGDVFDTFIAWHWLFS